MRLPSFFLSAGPGCAKRTQVETQSVGIAQTVFSSENELLSGRNEALPEANS
jgi:hypothetical protein